MERYEINKKDLCLKKMVHKHKILNSMYKLLKFLHLCTFKTPIIYTSFLDFYEFYFLEHIFDFYYKHLPKCSYNILLV